VIHHHRVETNGVHLNLVDAGEGPLVVLLHGFPESSYSWRHQVKALARAGYRVVAPDQRGYAASDAPESIDAYDQVELANDVAGLVDALGGGRAVVVGHDWGAPVAYHTALLHPEKVRGVVGMSVPWGGRPPASPLARMREIFKDVFYYILYFQEPGVAEAELETDVRRSLRSFYHSASGDAALSGGFTPHPPSARLLETMTDPGERLPDWLRADALEVFAAQFEQSGFRGPINWYRNFDRSWERTADLAGRKIEQPTLFVCGDRDPVAGLMSKQLERMKAEVPNLAPMVLLEGCGHWTQQERAVEVNKALVDFLDALPEA
jgi:pimeloyl-ACP methyl ester carboxylesterase